VKFWLIHSLYKRLCQPQISHTVNPFIAESIKSNLNSRLKTIFAFVSEQVKTRKSFGYYTKKKVASKP